MGSFSVKVPREEATKAQGRAAEAGTGPPSPCVTARGRGVPLAQEAPGRSEATARPPQRSQPISTAHGSSTVFVLMERPKFCGHRFPGGVFSCLGAGAGRVQGSSFARHFTAVDFELGPGRPPWPPWLLPGLQAQSVVGGAGNWGGHGRCTACLAGARVEGGPGGPGGGRKSPCVPQVLATPWASFPSSALPVGFCGSFPWCPGPQPCGSMRRKAGSRGVRDCGALAPAHSGGGTALPEPSVPTMVWSSNHPKERRGGHLVQAPGRSTWTGPCERVCRPLAVPGPPHQRSSADTQGCSQPPPCQPLGRQAAAGDAVGTGGDQAVPTAAFPKHRMNF